MTRGRCWERSLRSRRVSGRSLDDREGLGSRPELGLGLPQRLAQGLSGRPRDGHRALREGHSPQPIRPHGLDAYVGIAAAHFVAGRYETSSAGTRRRAANPKPPGSTGSSRSAYVFAGRQKEVKRQSRKQPHYPGLGPSGPSVQSFSERVRDQMSEGLRRRASPNDNPPPRSDPRG